MLATLSIEAFKNRFFLEKCPHWFAYQTTGKAEMIGKFRNDVEGQSEEDLLEYSWMQFEEMTQDYVWGQAKVICKSSPTAIKDKSPSMTVEWGEVPARRGRATTTRSGMQQGQQGTWPMMQYFLSEQNKANKELRDLQMETMRLNMENQRLAEQLEADNAPDIKEQMMIEGIGAFKTIATNYFSRPAPPPVASLGTMGVRNTGGDQEEKADQADQPEQPPKRPLSIDQSMPYVKAIVDLFPEYDPITVLKAFYNLAYTNKELIGGQLKAVIENGQG